MGGSLAGGHGTGGDSGNLRRAMGEEKDPVGEGRALGRRWGGDGKGTGRGKWAGPQRTESWRGQESRLRAGRASHQL